LADGVSDHLRQEDVLENVELRKEVVELKHEPERSVSEVVPQVLEAAGVGLRTARRGRVRGGCAGMRSVAALRNAANALGLEQRGAIKEDLSSLGHVESAEDVQKGALSAAAGAHDGQEAAARDSERDAAQDREDGPPEAEALVDLFTVYEQVGHEILSIGFRDRGSARVCCVRSIILDSHMPIHSYLNDSTGQVLPARMAGKAAPATEARMARKLIQMTSDHFQMSGILSNE